MFECVTLQKFIGFNDNFKLWIIIKLVELITACDRTLDSFLVKKKKFLSLVCNQYFHMDCAGSPGNLKFISIDTCCLAIVI